MSRQARSGISRAVTGPFHAGELALQRRAGVGDDARDVGRIIRSTIPAGAARYLARQSFAVAASVEREGRVWASLLSGPEGFVRVAGETTLQLAAQPLPGDPLAAALESAGPLGLLVLDPRTRQRLRFNGRGRMTGDGVVLTVEQAYGNCPKYIQRRTLESGGGPAPPGATRIEMRLDDRQRDWIRRADTLFIASAHPRGGADASHRGGRPGFVRLLSPDRLAFEDYAGNGMFNTLGNLVENPRAGLLFVDFESGDLLQLAGRAEVGDDFAVRFDVEAVRETPRGTPLRSRLVEYSPVLPELSRTAPGGISKT
jgi:hypothetical protein